MFTINNFSIANADDLKELPKNEEYQKHILLFLKDWFSASTTIASKTSGSTGAPKTIKLNKKAVLKSAELTTTFFKLKKGNNALLCLPTNFIAGKLMLIRALYSELNLISVPPSRNPLKDLNNKIDFAAMTPMQVNTILKETPQKLNLISTLIIGGAPVEKSLEHKLKVYSTKCYSTFGMTETITHIALKQLNKENFFTALPTITFDQSKDQCLTILAPHISPTPLKTNDKVDLVSPTSFIWKGRKDNVINSGGIKIQAEELEIKISKLIPNNRLFVSSVEDETFGTKIILIIEADSHFDLTKIEFNSIDKYSIPKAIYTIPKFIETETGKIKRHETRALLDVS